MVLCLFLLFFFVAVQYGIFWCVLFTHIVWSLPLPRKLNVYFIFQFFSLSLSLSWTKTTTTKKTRGTAKDSVIFQELTQTIDAFLQWPCRRNNLFIILSFSKIFYLMRQSKKMFSFFIIFFWSHQKKCTVIRERETIIRNFFISPFIFNFSLDQHHHHHLSLSRIIIWVVCLVKKEKREQKRRWRALENEIFFSVSWAEVLMRFHAYTIDKCFTVFLFTFNLLHDNIYHHRI